MKNAVLLSFTAGLLSFSQGTAISPEPVLPDQVQTAASAQDALVFEATGVRIFALECSKRLARRMQEEELTDFAFISPGATCMNALRPDQALPLPDFLNSAIITPGRDAQSLDIQLISRSNTRYLLHLNLGWSGSFDRLP